MLFTFPYAARGAHFTSQFDLAKTDARDNDLIAENFFRVGFAIFRLHDHFHSFATFPAVGVITLAYTNELIAVLFQSFLRAELAWYRFSLRFHAFRPQGYKASAGLFTPTVFY